MFLLIPFGLLTLYMGFLALLFLLFYFNRGEPKLIYSSIGLFFYIIMILVLFFPYQATLFSVPLEIQLSIQITILKMLIPDFYYCPDFYYPVSLPGIRFSGYHRIAIVSVSIILVMIIINAAILFQSPENDFQHSTIIICCHNRHSLSRFHDL